MHTYLTQIAERVRGVRANRGMTRKDLVAHSGISERYLAQLEAGKANMSVSVLWQLASAMDVSVTDLLPGAKDSGGRLPTLNNFVERLDISQQKTALEMLMRHFADERGPVKGVALIGLRGAGKTTLGQLLAGEVGIPFIKLGDVIEEIGGMDKGAILSLRGQRAYRRLEREALEHVKSHYDNVVLEVGGSIASQTDSFEAILNSFYTVWLRATPEDHMQRVIEQGDMRPFEDSSQAKGDIELILAERSPIYQAAHYIIDTSGRTQDVCANELIAQCRCFCCKWQWGK